MKMPSKQPRFRRGGADDLLPEYDFVAESATSMLRDTSPEAPWWSWNP